MPNFTSFPTNYAPIIHTDEHGTPIEQEKRHTLSQGWLSMFSMLNQILAGRWERPSIDKQASVSKCSLTPYSLNIYLEYSTPVSGKVLTLPIAAYGMLFVYNSTGTLINQIKVSGPTVTIPTGSLIIGTLSV